MSGSYITIKSHKLYTMCENVIKNIELYRRQRIDALIKSEMEKRNKPFLWIFKRKPLSEAQVRYTPKVFEEIVLISGYGCGTEGIAYELMKACAYADDVQVSTDDLYAIEGWLDKNIKQNE